MKTPFNSPRDSLDAPYHLRNGIAERAEIESYEAEHRRRLGMSCPHCAKMSVTIDALKLQIKDLERRFAATQR